MTADQPRPARARFPAWAGDAPPTGYTRDDRRRDFRAAFSATPAGRRVLAQLVTRCRVAKRSFAAGDTHETARREGMRDVGLWLLDILDADPAGAQDTAETEEEQHAR